MGETKTPHFYDLGISDVSPGPKTNYLTPWHLKKTRKSRGRFQKVLVLKITKFWNSFVWQFSQRRAPRNPEDPSNNSLKILEMESTSSKKTRNGNVGKMDQISFRNIKGFSESLKPKFEYVFIYVGSGH